MPTKLETKTAEITAKRTKLNELFTSNTKPEGITFTAAQIDEVKTLNTELTAIGKEVADLRVLEDIETKNRAELEALQTPGRTIPFPGGSGGSGFNIEAKGHYGAALEPPDLGKMFIESKGFKAWKPGHVLSASMPEIETKTLFQTSAGWTPFVPRIARVALSPQQQPRVIDAFATGTTGSAAIKFMQEDTFTNNAAGVAEAAAYPESAYHLAEITQNVNKLATFLPVTDEQLEDNQLVTGSGSGANLTGLQFVSGIQTAAQVGGDATTDTILKAIVKVQSVGFSEPSAVLFHPTDWMNVRLLKTPDGIYIWGHPSQTGPAMIWGLPVIASTYVTLGTSYVGDFKGQCQVFYRRGLEFLVTNSNNDDFTHGRQCIRCDMRVVLVVYRPKAVYKATGL